MSYLEQRKLVHRDLAARNVLVGEKISGYASFFYFQYLNAACFTVCPK